MCFKYWFCEQLLTQKTIDNFLNETYSKPPKKNYNINQTDVYYIDNNWSLNILDLKEYGTENKRRFRHVLVAIDNLSKFGWTVHLKNSKNDEIIKDSFKNYLITAIRKPDLIETDDGKEIAYKFFTDFFGKKFKRHSRYTSLGAVFAERFNRTIRDLPKKPVFEKGDGSWLDVLPTIKKQKKSRIHSSVKLTPIQCSSKTNEKIFNKN